MHFSHSSGTSHWLDPRLSKFQKKSLEDCLDDELPYGWEKISDPQYGTYFIDHVNRRTQYENPVIQAKRAAEHGLNVSCLGRASFTRDPSELCGQRFTTALLKSSRGLGFTIVGGDDDVDEFLQIKSVVPNGPAWLDGKLQTGDLIVYVNDTCVLGYSHNQIVHLFQSIAPGETVVLEVCRGYSLPFDPNDPNTEVVTTIAVDSNLETADSEKVMLNLNADGNFNFLESGLDQQDNLLKDSNCNVNSLTNSTDGVNCAMKELSISTSSHVGKSIVSISIVKGTLGFGFTIADSACGQRVKKILDRQRCKNLLEGDILMEINAIDVQEMSHDDVVQVLKNCTYNEEAVICVQRGSVTVKANASKNKIRKLENGRFSGKDVAGQYRSKTPTADLYSTQQKEVLPSRPKTPLVDTRTRIKTPLGDDSAANSTTSLKSLRRGDVGELFNYDRLSESSPYQLDNPGLSCSQTDISVNMNDHACKLLYGNYDSAMYGRYSAHMDSCYCYECKQLKMQPLNDIRPMHIDTNTYDGNEYVNRNLDRRKDILGLDYRDSNRHLDNWQWVPQSTEYVECFVTLVRQETGFGFRIVGGTEEGSQVAVGHVVPGGAADLDGRINTGDEILSVDGHSVLKASHHQVVQLMGGAAARGRVTLCIRRRIHHLPIQHAPTYDVVVNRSENEGFGFVIISSVNKAGSTIGKCVVVYLFMLNDESDSFVLLL